MRARLATPRNQQPPPLHGDREPLAAWSSDHRLTLAVWQRLLAAAADAARVVDRAAGARKRVGSQAQGLRLARGPALVRAVQDGVSGGGLQAQAALCAVVCWSCLVVVVSKSVTAKRSAVVFAACVRVRLASRAPRSVCAPRSDGPAFPASPPPRMTGTHRRGRRLRQVQDSMAAAWALSRRRHGEVSLARDRNRSGANPLLSVLCAWQSCVVEGELRDKQDASNVCVGGQQGRSSILFVGRSRRRALRNSRFDLRRPFPPSDPPNFFVSIYTCEPSLASVPPILCWCCGCGCDGGGVERGVSA